MKHFLNLKNNYKNNKNPKHSLGFKMGILQDIITTSLPNIEQFVFLEFLDTLVCYNCLKSGGLIHYLLISCVVFVGQFGFRACWWAWWSLCFRLDYWDTLFQGVSLCLLPWIFEVSSVLTAQVTWNLCLTTNIPLARAYQMAESLKTPGKYSVIRGFQNHRAKGVDSGAKSSSVLRQVL